MRDSLTAQAANTIKRFILLEQLSPNSQLPSKRELSETLAVSRNVVREALRARQRITPHFATNIQSDVCGQICGVILLQVLSTPVAEGLISKQPGRGVFVNAYDPVKVLLPRPWPWASILKMDEFLV
ncbi:MAG: winged helix-turn-helix transcriptional regulator [Chloroflexi bacterium]|nr:winged helix-turn-helix transcriptional regulator [Chloroflexota bacterium]